jgi:hypothetical protein
MEKKVIILDGKFSEETNMRINEFVNYMASLNEVQSVSIGGGGFINIKPKKQEAQKTSIGGGGFINPKPKK